MYIYEYFYVIYFKINEEKINIGKKAEKIISLLGGCGC